MTPMASERQSCDSWTLNQWQTWFAEIYGRRNHFTTPDQTWYRQLEEIGETLKLARRSELEDFRMSLPDVAAWLFAFCDVQQIALQDAVWTQFMNGCPWCHARENCVCIYDYPAKRPLPLGEDLFSAKPDVPLNQWVHMFDTLYGRVYRRHDLAELVTYLTETAGVIAKIHRTRQPTPDLRAAVANFFAWTVGVFLRYKSITQEQTTFAQLIMEKYATCPKCRLRPCTCLPVVKTVLVGVALPPTITEPTVRRVVKLCAERELDYGFADRLGGHAEQTRHALRADALLLIISGDLPDSLASLYHIVTQSGKPTAVFAYGSVQSEPLRDFLTEIQPTGHLHHIRDGTPPAGLDEWFSEVSRRDRLHK
jgi:NTP pyrophosphatase (non-canonical NTP hydrolase)